MAVVGIDMTVVEGGGCVRERENSALPLPSHIAEGEITPFYLADYFCQDRNEGCVTLGHTCKHKSRNLHQD